MKLINPRRWFWLTLRLIPKRGHWFTKGIRVCVILLTRCPLKCPYCPMTIYNDVKKFEERSLEEWKTFFKRLPHWPSLVYLSGGEPSLYRDIVSLTNWLINRGHHVIIFSNLWKIENFQGIRPSWRLIFFPTFHATDNRERYTKALIDLEKRYNVFSTEFEKKTILNEAHSAKNFWSEDWFKNTDDTFHVPPDAPKNLNLFLGCVELYREKR